MGINPNFISDKAPDYSIEELFADPFTLLATTSTRNSLPLQLKFDYYLGDHWAIGLQFGYMSTYTWTTNSYLGDTVVHVEERLIEGDFITIELAAAGRYYFNKSTSKWRPYVEAGLGFVQHHNNRYGVPYSTFERLRDRPREVLWNTNLNPNVQIGLVRRIKDHWGIEVGANLRRINFYQGMKAGITGGIQYYVTNDSPLPHNRKMD